MNNTIPHDITYEYIKVEKAGAKENVGVITFNRPKALNVLSASMMLELLQALDYFDADHKIGAIIITGGEIVFTAGIDIKEMQHHTYSKCVRTNFTENWNRISGIKKPVIAAVNGYALGGGTEIAMMCDIIYAGEKAKFGLPEVSIGTIPGAGGTQRLPRYVGKSKAMEMILTGNHITAVEAEQMGVVSKIFAPEKLLEEAVKLGEKISSNSPLIVSLAKEAINTAYETSLNEGLHFEKRTFYATFGTKDRQEGMTAFVEKRPAHFTNE